MLRSSWVSRSRRPAAWRRAGNDGRARDWGGALPIPRDGWTHAERLDAAIAGVGHVGRAVGCHRHTKRVAELPVAGALAAPFTEERAILWSGWAVD
jgi:hypothetical protein